MGKTTRKVNGNINRGVETIRKELDDLCRQILEISHPQKIILFGSYAYGSPREDSDVDILVVMPFEGHPAYQAGRIRSQLQTPLPVDLMVRTPVQIDERISIDDPFMKEIIGQGKVLYETNHNGMDSQSRDGLDQCAA